MKSPITMNRQKLALRSKEVLLWANAIVYIIIIIEKDANDIT